MWRSDGGATWDWGRTGLPRVPIQALALDPPSRLYAGTDGAGVYHSSSGGGLWEPRTTGLINLDVTALTVDPQAPTTVYVATAWSGILLPVVRADRRRPVAAPDGPGRRG